MAFTVCEGHSGRIEIDVELAPFASVASSLDPAALLCGGPHRATNTGDLDMPTTNVAPQPAQRMPAAVTASSRFTLAQVVGRAVTARNTVTFWLAAPGTTRAPAPYQPGQFVTLALPSGAQRQVIYRSYSLCGDGRPDQPWEITVKRHVGGVGSSYLHDRVTPGMTLPVSAPGGAFTLPAPQAISAAKTLIFVAACSGVTPIYGMLRALATLPPERRPQAQLHYSYHSPQDAIYGDALTALDPQGTWLRQWRYVSSTGQRMSVKQIAQAAGEQAVYADWYLCGPTELMRAVERAAKQVGAAPEHIHTERFFSPPQPAARTAAAGGAVARVRVAETGAMLQGQAGESLLETLERHGYEADFSCRAGSCGTCRLRVLGGRVRNPNGQALTPAERAAGYVESCIAQPLGEVTIALDGVASPPPRAVPAARGKAAAKGRAAAAAALATGRAATRRKARWTLAVASIALFGTVWNLTDHKIVSASATTSSSSSSSSSSGSSGSSASDSGSSSSSNNSTSSSSSNGSSIFSSQPSFGSSNSSTGVS